MQPAARVGDLHVCPMVTPGTPPVPHVGGPILPPGGVTVLIGGVPAARMGDMCTCVGPPDVIAQGAMNVLICGQPAARMGDMTVHGGSITVGCPTVLIGMSGGGGGSAGGTAAANAGQDGAGESGQHAEKAEGIFDKFKLNVTELFGLGAGKKAPTKWNKGDASEDDGSWQPELGIQLGAEYELLESKSEKVFGDADASHVALGNREAKAVAGYSYDALDAKHTAQVGVEGKASVLEAKGVLLDEGGLVEAEVSGEVLSIAGKVNLLKVESSPEEFSAVAEAGVEAVLIKGEASGQVNITPKTIYDNTLGPIVGLVSPAHSKAPDWMDHGVVVGAKGEVGIAAAAEASAGLVSKDGVTGITAGAKLGAGPMAGLKLFLGIK